MLSEIDPLLKEDYLPFKSEAQRRFMHARHPKIAKRWEKETPSGRLPRKKKKRNPFLQAAKRRED